MTIVIVLLAFALIVIVGLVWDLSRTVVRLARAVAKLEQEIENERS